MHLVKHSERLIRKPCRCHGSNAVYWAHDSDCHHSKTGEPLAECAQCGVTGAFVMIDANPVTRALRPGDAVPSWCIHDRKGDAPADPPDSEVEITPAAGYFTCVAYGCDVQNADVRFYDVDGGAHLCPDHAPKPKPQEETVIEPPAAETAQAQPVDAVSEALAVLAAAMGPKIDEDAIRRIVAEQIDATVFPTRTVVVNSAGHDVTPADMPETSHAMLSEVLTVITAARTSPVPMSVLMVGPAGSGKSTIARNVATALGMRYGEISLNPMLPVTSLLGYMNATGDYVSTVFRDIWENGGIFCFDEADNSHPSTLATINAALAQGKGGSIAFPDGMVTRHDDFVTVASANTYGRGPDRMYVGRQQLDAATLNRFVAVEIGYDEALEHSLCLATGLDRDKSAEVLRYVRAVRANAVTKKMTVLVSPRNAVFACALLKAGMSRTAVVANAIRQGMSEADWHKASEGVPPLTV